MIIKIPDGYDKSQILALLFIARDTLKKETGPQNVANNTKMRKLCKLLVSQISEQDA